MTDIDWDRIQPLRLARGSHQKGSGFGCVMNVVSYISGDSYITDSPECADQSLARMMQALNDKMARDNGTLYNTGEINHFLTDTAREYDMSAAPIYKQHYLVSPEDAVALIRLGTKTIGTAGSLTLVEQDMLYGTVLSEWCKKLDISISPGYTDDKERYVDLLLVLRDIGYADKWVEFAESVLDMWREMAGLDEAVEVPDLSEVLL